MYDIVFVIDGSGSVGPLFQIQAQGIYEAVCGLNAFVPADGSTAVAIIEFSRSMDVELPLTVIDQTNIGDICDCIGNSLEPQGGYTYPSNALMEAKRIIDEEAAGSQRYVVFSSDGFPNADDVVPAENACRALRTSNPPVKICSIIIPPAPIGCSGFPHDPLTTEEQFMSDCANSEGQEPDQPIGGLGCAETAGQYSALAAECLCFPLQQGGPDCNGNNIPDACEYANDCNANHVPDKCEIDQNSQAPGGPYFCDPAVGFELPGGGTEPCDTDCNENPLPTTARSTASPMVCRTIAIS